VLIAPHWTGPSRMVFNMADGVLPGGEQKME
jgi:hypothetical protein